MSGLEAGRGWDEGSAVLLGDVRDAACERATQSQTVLTGDLDVSSGPWAL